MMRKRNRMTNALTNLFDALRSLRTAFAIEVMEAPAPSPTMCERDLFDGLHLSQWRVSLAETLGRRFGVLVFVERNSHGERVIRAFGPTASVAKVQETFHWLSQRVEEMSASTRLRGKTARQSYCVGFVKGLADTLAEPLPGVTSETELRAALGRALPTWRAPRTFFRESALAKGARAGAKIEVHA